jgi:hypothetical protein
VVNSQAIVLVAAWASQAFGVKPGIELGGAGVLVPQIGDREVHDRLQIQAIRSNTPEYRPEGRRLETTFPPDARHEPVMPTRPEPEKSLRSPLNSRSPYVMIKLPIPIPCLPSSIGRAADS